MAHDGTPGGEPVNNAGRITVSRLEIDTIVGAYARERKVLQTIYLDLDIDYDFGPPAASDDLTAAVDYHHLSNQLARYIQDQQFELLETLTVSSSAFLLEHYPSIRGLTITVHKPSALGSAEQVSASFSQSAT